MPPWPMRSWPIPGVAAWLRPAGVLAASLAVWWLVVTVGRVPAFLLPGPGRVAETLVVLARDAGLARHLATTTAEIATGFTAGALAGLALGWAFDRAPRLGRFLSPLVVLLQTAPKIAIAPLLILWLGLGLGPKVVLIAIVVFLPVLAGTTAGLAAVEPAYRDLARLLRLTPAQRFRRIEAPFALVPVFAGLRIAATQAVTAAVIGELMGATHGLGYLLSLGQENGDAGIVIAAILILSALGWLLNGLIAAVERRVLAWREVPG